MFSANYILFLLITSLFYASIFTPRFLVRAQRSAVDNNNSNVDSNLDSDSDTNSKLKPIYMGVVAIGVIIFLTILYYIARVCGDCSGQPGLNSTTQGRDGLDPEILNEFPVYTYPNVADRTGPKTGPLECAVCLSPYKEEQSLRLIPTCDHMFHLHCVDRWLEAHTTCPVCRANLVDALSPSRSGHSQSSRVESICVEELETGLGVGLIHQIQQNDDTVEMGPEIPGLQFWEIWRSNSTGHMADNLRVAEDVERFRLTN